MVAITECKFMEQEIWKKGMELSKETYALVKKLPTEELYALSSQMRRASTSIPSNIAEGYGRITTNEYINFLSYARGSCAELQTQLLLAVELGLLEHDDISVAFGLASDEYRMLSSTINTLSARVKK